MVWGLFVDGGRHLFLYRLSDHDPEIRLSGDTLSPGRHMVAATFMSDGKPGGGGTALLTIDGKPAGSTLVSRRWTFINLAGSVGMLGDQPIGAGQTLPFAYPGRIERVTIESDLNAAPPNG